jgi:hypothetical protein
MPLLRNKNQPYFPDPDSPNNYQCGPERYCHPVTVGDTVWSQFYQTPCNNNEVTDPEFDDYTLGSELVTNGDFAVNPAAAWSFGATFTWDNINTEMDCLNGSGDTLEQAGLGLLNGNLYKITFDCVITNGQFDVLFGYGDPNQTQTPTVTASGSYEFDLIYLAGPGNETITFLSALNFTGSITNVSVKVITNTYWTPNGDWILSDGQACHRVGGINDLDENVAAYIDANSYYKLEFTITNRTAGDISVGMANVNTGAVSVNGNFIYYLTPTATGTLTISANSAFDGCISDLAVYKLRNDYSAELIDANGNEYDVSDAFSYYQDYVTLDFQFDDYELADGCYTLNVYDQCLIESDNLVVNGDFVDGYTNWSRNNIGIQYDIIADQLQFKFYPFSQGFTDYVTNGDFSSGAAWTINTGWSIAGGKAVHTPGNTGTLFQTMTLPAPPPPATGYSYYVKFTVSNWTAGTITLKLGNAVNGTSYTWKGNDIFFQSYNPRQSGSVDLIFTPSSTFDGEIDDVACILPNAVSSFPIITNTANPLFTPGNYQTEWEIVSSSDPNISVNFNLIGALPSAPYQSDIGVQSYTQAYTLNGGSVRGVANFQKTSIDYFQTNLIEGDITVDNISVVKIEPFEATYTSECLQYNSNGFPRTKMIVGYCDQNAFGFEFQNTGFRLQQRAEIRSIAPTYPKTTNIMKMGTGDARIAYAEIEKYWQLHTGFASETFHDTMAAIISCDHFQIGDTETTGVEYIAEAEDYSPNWQTDGAYVLAAAVINLRVKEKGQVFNRHI